jgi:HD-like signal output (HDOD) protein
MVDAPGKRRILFVDDEVQVLEGLQRMLRGLRDQWDMKFVGSGAEALELLDREAIDILVTDMRMPGISGTELLSRVKERHPRIIRIVLSGQVEQEALLKSVELTHQFLAKPCDAEALRNIITRSTALHDLLESDALRQMVSGLKSLPSLPVVYTEILAELRSPTGSLARAGKIISTDLAMSAKILQLVNSSFFGLPRQMANPAQATIYLGMETIRTLVLSVNIFSQFAEKQRERFNIEGIYRHSMLTASIARDIAKQEGLSQTLTDFSFMAGMLHDVGKIVLAVNITGEYEAILQTAADRRISIYDAERERLRVTHAEVGAYLLGLWGFQDPLVEAVCFHHQPQRSASAAFSPLTAVHAANALAHGEESGQEPDAGALNRKYLDDAGKLGQLETWKIISRNIYTKGGSNE